MSKKYPTYESKFNALTERNPDAEGEFVYCVLSTTICCRPTCSSRLPLKKNIMFCDNVQEAVEKRFRPCKRCRPQISTGWNRARENVKKACLMIMKIANARTKLHVNALANELGLSKWHFCRTFKNYTGYTPQKYYKECTQGSNPLILKPLPLIQTKKNLQKQRALSRSEFQEKAQNVNKKIPCETTPNNNYQYFTSMQYEIEEKILNYDPQEMFACLQQDIELDSLNSIIENTPTSAGVSRNIFFGSGDLLAHENI